MRIFSEADPSLDEKSLQFLVRLFEKNDQQGFDYLEFKQSFTALQQMNMDMGTAMKSAFTTAKTVGLTREKLLASALHYQKLLAIEREHFNEELKRQLDKKVGAQIEEAQLLRKTALSYEEQIVVLQRKMEEAKIKLVQVEAEVQEEKGKLAQTQAAFESTLTSLVDLIDKDVQFIEQYI